MDSQKDSLNMTPNTLVIRGSGRTVEFSIMKSEGDQRMRPRNVWIRLKILF